MKVNTKDMMNVDRLQEKIDLAYNLPLHPFTMSKNFQVSQALEEQAICVTLSFCVGDAKQSENCYAYWEFLSPTPLQIFLTQATIQIGICL